MSAIAGSAGILMFQHEINYYYSIINVIYNY